VQIIKAILLLGGATLMAILVLAKFGFNHWRFSMQQLSNIKQMSLLLANSI